MTTVAEYKQGMTEVWTDGEKLIITNTSGKGHVKDNVEQIFGMGEYDKMVEVCYRELHDRKTAFSTYKLMTGYIPERAVKDLAEKSLPGIKDKDFFKFGEE